MPDAQSFQEPPAENQSAETAIPPPLHDELASDPYAHWLTKRQVGKKLRRSERTVDKLAADGKIQKTYRNINRPNYRSGRRGEPIYNPDDVERLRTGHAQFVMPSESSNGHSSTIPAPVFPALAENAEITQTAAVVKEGFKQFCSVLSQMLAEIPAVAHAVAPVPLPLWLSIDDASRFSGLSTGRLRRFVRDGSLAAVRQKGGMRICRGDLEQLRANDFRRQSQGSCAMSRPYCPFYGMYASTAMKAFVGQGGNQCALLTSSYSPCHMEIAGRAPDWSACGFNILGREDPLVVLKDFKVFPRLKAGDSGIPFEQWFAQHVKARMEGI